MTGVVDPEIFAGQELCGYIIRRKLAEGGMGVVYEAVHSKIGRPSAIKILKLEFCRSEDMIARFHQEALAVNAIRHENIVDIYDFDRDAYGRVFFVMEYLEGEPLSERIRRGALPWSDAFPILAQTLRALKAAHDKGIVHRDLKPDNIWLKSIDGRVQVKLLDFGIAKLVGADRASERMTQTGSVIGTPHYMSPEQINGSKDIDHRTDIYSLGVIVYEMFAGVMPFAGDTVQAVMMGHLFTEPPRLANIPARLGVPATIADVVDRMLVKDALGRYACVTDVLADLHDLSNQRSPSIAEELNHARPTRVPAAAAADKPRRTRRAAIVITLALGGVALAVASFAIGGAQPESPPAPLVGRAVGSGETPTTRNLDQRDVPGDASIDDVTVRTEHLARIRGALKHTEPVVRAEGARALGNLKDRPSAPVLAERTERDDDHGVRGHAAEALGVVGASSTVRLLARLEAGAPPQLKVWYASALARLGEPGAVKRLYACARSKDLAVSFKAGLTLADISRPGDPRTIAALRALAAREAELNETAPYAGALILTKLAALRDRSAHTLLHDLLEHSDEGAQLAAAEGLAKLGDDAGRNVLQKISANAGSPNRLTAAVAQIGLGEYGGLDLITGALDDKDASTRRLAARALGEIGDRESLRALIALSTDRDWTVRIAASTAIVMITGLAPHVLAQASVDWTRSALASQDWAERKAAAGVLADIPEDKAVPLLALAIADRDANVRLAATMSAGKMKTAEAANKVAAAVKTETDPVVKEQQVKALGEIGSPAVHDVLAQLSEEPGRIGVLAAGSLIAVGDAAGAAKLEAAVSDRNVDLRLAAVQAASIASTPIVVPMLKIGVADRMFSVRFIAAEVLATLRAEKALAMPVLTAALESKDADVVGRALAALIRLGETIKDKLRDPSEMLDSPDPKLRLAAVPIVRALPANDGVPLLRRLVADPDQDVRRAGVDAIEVVVTKDKDQAIRLYKPLVDDADPVVRSKAAGQLSRLTDPGTRAATPPPVVPDTLRRSHDEASTAAGDAKIAAATFEAFASDLSTMIATPPSDDTAIRRVEELTDNVDEAAAALDTEAAKVEAAAAAVSAAASATPSPGAEMLINDAHARARDARDAAIAGRETADEAVKQARGWIKDWARDVNQLIATGDAALVAGDVAAAKQSFDQAAKLIRSSGVTNANLDYSYAELYDRMAKTTQDPAAKVELLRHAAKAYKRFTSVGAGPRVQRATDRLTEINDAVTKLAQP